MAGAVKNSEVVVIDTTPIQSRFGKLVSTIKPTIWIALVCFMGLTVVSLTMFLYFVVIVYFLETLQATSGKELSPNTIADFSLIGSVLGSFSGGAFLGRIAPSHPTRFAAVVGVIFMILQLNQLAFFQELPVWFTVLSIISYPPCCVYAAKRTARRLTPKFEASESPIAAPDAVATAPAGAAEPSPPPVADGEAEAEQAHGGGGDGDGDGAAGEAGGGEADAGGGVAAPQ